MEKRLPREVVPIRRVRLYNAERFERQYRTRTVWVVTLTVLFVFIVVIFIVGVAGWISYLL